MVKFRQLSWNACNSIEISAAIHTLAYNFAFILKSRIILKFPSKMNMMIKNEIEISLVR